jgi:uncharacterized protein (TIGR01777 family)
MRVVLAGGTGYIGRALVRALTAGGHEVVVLTRRPPREPGGPSAEAREARWDPANGPGAGWAAELRGAGAVVNLAGANIGTRPWTPGRQREILDSRLRATGALVEAMAALPAGERPGAFVSASGVDYYGARGDETLDESSPPGDSSLLAGVCERWEAAAREAEALGVRVVRMRTGLVLSRGSQALRLMAMPFRLFAGGPVGSGRQWVSWIHLADVVGLYVLAAGDATIAGPLNAVAPEPVRNAELAAEIGRVLRRPVWLRAPEPVLRLALRRQAEVLLVGHRVRPAVALAHGHAYRHPTLAAALADSLGRPVAAT